jgi:hypothetical protein
MHAVWAPLILFAATSCGQVPREPSAEEISRAIQQLGDPDFQVRQRATDELIRFGKAAQSQIERAAANDDQEVAQRAKAILRRLRRPPTAPPELEQLERDFLDTPSRRSSLVWRLADPSEFALVSKLIGSIKSPAERKSLEESFHQRITNLAHELCQQGYIDDAEKVLAAAVDDPEVEATLFAVWLEFDRMTDRISQAERELAEKLNPPTSQRLARMWRAAGNRAKAREVAMQAKDYEYAMWLAAEGGDWSAALRAHELSREGKRRTFGDARFTMLLSHYAGNDEKSAESAKALHEFVKTKNLHHSAVVPALLAAEQYDIGIELLEAHLPSRAFALHCSRHDYERAFRLAKIPVGAEIDVAWYESLLDTSPPDPYDIARRPFASEIAIALNSVGRRDDALRVIAVMHKVLDARSQSDELATIARTWLGMGDRRQAIAETIRAAEAEARRPRPPVPKGVPTGSRLPSWWMGYLYPTPQTFLVRDRVWPMVAEYYGHDHRKVFAVLESHFDPPTRSRLAADQRGSLLDELESAPATGGADRQAEWMKKVAEVAELHGDLSRAARLREHAYLLDGRSRPSGKIRGTEAFTRRDWEESAKWLPRGLNAYSVDWASMMRLGVSLIALGRYEEGESLISRSSKLSPGPATYAGEAGAFLHAGLTERGVERFDVVARLLPPDGKSAEIHRKMLVYDLRGASPMDAARAWQLNSLINLEFDIYSKVEDYLAHGRVLREARFHELLKLGKAAEAVAEVKRGLEIEPGDVELVTTVAPALDAAGNRSLGDELFSQLKRHLTRTCNSYPRSTEHRRLLAVASARCNRGLDDGLQRINEAIELNPQASALRSALAEVQLARGAASAARQAACDGLSLDPSDADCRAILTKINSSQSQLQR